MDKGRYTKLELQNYAINTWRTGYGYDKPIQIYAFNNLQKDISKGRVKTPRAINYRAQKYGTWF
jgi:hypothetical protein